MNELQTTLKRLEQTLGKLQVAGPATIIMGDAFRLLYQAQGLAEPKKRGEKEEEQKNA